ncbi:MAG: hypothetical protein WDO68_31375 [Gammaproteobacteria bacterium]
MLAALDLLRGDAKAEKWTKRSLDYNPHWGGVYETLAHYEIMRRMYTQANDWLQKSVATQPDRWSAQAELGVNLLRLGQVDASRAALEKAYSGDPFSATTVNTLRVLDKLKTYSVVRTNAPDIVTWLDPKEADAMRPYVEEVARQAITTYSNRYAFKPAQPVTIEVYPNHDDFAVRTAGLPGIGSSALRSAISWRWTALPAAPPATSTGAARSGTRWRTYSRSPSPSIAFRAG